MAGQSPTAGTEGQDMDTPTPTPDSTAGRRAGSETNQNTERLATSDNCTAIGAALGVVSAILLLALVGVVTGWVWTCHRYRLTPKQR